MRDGIDEAAVDQRQPVRRKRCRHRHAIGAVTVEQQRRACVAGKIAPVQQRHRHLRAVMRGRHDAGGDVIGGIVAGWNFLPLAQNSGPACHVVVVDFRGRRHR